MGDWPSVSLNNAANLERDIATVSAMSSTVHSCSGLSFIDYRSIAEDETLDNNFLTIREINTRHQYGIFKTFGGYVTQMKVGNTSKGKYARLVVENNYKLHKVIIWASEYENFKDLLKGCEKRIILFSAELKYDGNYTKGNQFTFKEGSFLKVF